MMFSFCKIIVVCVNETVLQEPNTKSIVLLQLKFLRNQNTQIKIFNNQNVLTSTDSRFSGEIQHNNCASLNYIMAGVLLTIHKK